MVRRNVEGEGSEGGAEGEGFEREGEDGSRKVGEREVGEGGEGWTVSCEEGCCEIGGSGVVGGEGEVFELREKRVNEGLKEKTCLDSSEVEGEKIVKIERWLRVGFEGYARGREVHESSSDQAQDLQLRQTIEQGYDWVPPFPIDHPVHQHP